MAKTIEMSAAGIDGTAIAGALVEVAKRWVTSLDDPEGWVGEFIAQLEAYPSGFTSLCDLQEEYDRATEALKEFKPFIDDE